MQNKKIFWMTLLICLFILHPPIWTANLNCDVCGMTLSENAKNHIVLKNEAVEKNTLHVCSFTCFLKAKKNAPKYSKVEISDFNNPGKFLDADKAFFLVKSAKIKKDLGELVMPPYFGAFATKQLAETAKAKYGDGIVVRGIDNAAK